MNVYVYMHACISPLGLQSHNNHSILWGSSCYLCLMTPHTHTHTHTHTCMHNTSTHIAYMKAYIFTYAYIRYVYTHICMPAYTYIHSRILAYIHACMHTYMLAYIRTCMNACISANIYCFMVTRFL
jgi:hypothetical protein